MLPELEQQIKIDVDLCRLKKLKMLMISQTLSGI